MPELRAHPQPTHTRGDVWVWLPRLSPQPYVDQSCSVALGAHGLGSDLAWHGGRSQLGAGPQSRAARLTRPSRAVPLSAAPWSCCCCLTGFISHPRLVWRAQPPPPVPTHHSERRWDRGWWQRGQPWPGTGWCCSPRVHAALRSPRRRRQLRRHCSPRAQGSGHAAWQCQRQGHQACLCPMPRTQGAPPALPHAVSCEMLTSTAALGAASMTEVLREGQFSPPGTEQSHRQGPAQGCLVDPVAAGG